MSYEFSFVLIFISLLFFFFCPYSYLFHYFCSQSKWSGYVGLGRNERGGNEFEGRCKEGGASKGS